MLKCASSLKHSNVIILDKGVQMDNLPVTFTVRFGHGAKITFSGLTSLLIQEDIFIATRFDKDFNLWTITVRNADSKKVIDILKQYRVKYLIDGA